MTCRIENISGVDWTICDTVVEAEVGRTIDSCWLEQWKDDRGTRWVKLCPSLDMAVDSASRDDELREMHRMNHESETVGLPGLPKLIGLRFVDSIWGNQEEAIKEHVASYEEPKPLRQPVIAASTLLDPTSLIQSIDLVIPMLQAYINAGADQIMQGAHDKRGVFSFPPGAVTKSLEQAQYALDGLKNIRSVLTSSEFKLSGSASSATIRQYYNLLSTELQTLPTKLNLLKTNLIEFRFHEEFFTNFGTRLWGLGGSFRAAMGSFVTNARAATVASIPAVVNSPVITSIKNASSGLGPWGKVAIGAGIAALAAGVATYFWLTSE